ncbi:MAG: hypothetical protein KDK27_17945 [Leptospiraceae bacterium]|nr:hypothetical protein [Leptospiraceae bacterium]
MEVGFCSPVPDSENLNNEVTMQINVQRFIRALQRRVDALEARVEALEATELVKQPVKEKTKARADAKKQAETPKKSGKAPEPPETEKTGNDGEKAAEK